MKRVTVIAGPTASGKSALAVEKARTLGTEIVSADSRQIYRGMPILTAVPTMQERAGTKHHLLEVLEPEEYFSAAMYEQRALACLSDILSRQDEAIVCGGSMMYIDALCRGIDDLPTIPDELRQHLQAQLAARGADWAREELQRLDPEYYNIVDHANTKRIIHALEIIHASGQKYSTLRRGRIVHRPFEIEYIVLMPPRQQLFERINARVERMMQAGALQEAERLYPKRGLNSLNTVGFKELFAYLDGLMSLDEAVARIQKNTRVYAKKQMLWARRRGLV